MSVIVLYEDQRGPTREFGPHILVLACVCDAGAGGHRLFELRHLVEDRPLNGNGNLLRFLREKMADSRFETIIAVFDDDQIRPLLGLPQEASPERVKAQLRQECNAPQKLEVILLSKNMESVIQAAARCGEELGVEIRKVREAASKDRLARDICLSSLAYDPGRRPLRDCILRKVPAVANLVGLICQKLSS